MTQEPTQREMKRYYETIVKICTQDLNRYNEHGRVAYIMRYALAMAQQDLARINMGEALLSKLKPDEIPTGE